MTIEELRHQEGAMGVDHVATPLPWPAPEYSNDVGPCDDYLAQWWDVGPVRCNTKADAELVHRAVNSHDDLLDALRAAYTLFNSHAEGIFDMLPRDEEVVASQICRVVYAATGKLP